MNLWVFLSVSLFRYVHLLTPSSAAFSAAVQALPDFYSTMSQSDFLFTFASSCPFTSLIQAYYFHRVNRISQVPANSMQYHATVLDPASINISRVNDIFIVAFAQDRMSRHWDNDHFGAQSLHSLELQPDTSFLSASCISLLLYM